jgi:hypothetical protein
VYPINDMVPTTTEPSVGNFVAAFSPWARCWDAIGPLRAVYDDKLQEDIHTVLQECFDQVPRSDPFTFSLYMIGRSKTKAKPTILFISRSEHLRRDARRAIRESNIFRRYPSFRSKYVNKDPGTENIVSLAIKEAQEADIRGKQMATRVLYDMSKPISCMGLPIYIQHSSSLRLATANTVRVGGRIYLQTVHHAFFEEHLPAAALSRPATLGELVIDSDSETNDDSDDELHIGITSVGSQSKDTLASATSHLTRLSTGSSLVSGVSEFAVDNGWGEWGSNISTVPGAVDSTNMDDVIATLTSVACGHRTFSTKQPIQPSPDALVHLGDLLEGSNDNDWALVEITNDQAEEALRSSFTDNNKRLLAYDNVALHPRDDTEIYTYTASGGRISGVLSGTSSYSRLPHSTSFRKIYVVRLQDSLANGDCGSVVFDAKTGRKYGHLVAGCKSTGTAYVLAAHQTMIDFGEVSKRVKGIKKSTEHFIDMQDSQSGTPSPDRSHVSSTPLTVNWSCHETELLDPNPAPVSVQCGRHNSQPSKTSPVTPRTAAESPFLNLFSKEWPKEFFASRSPHDDRPCVEADLETLRSLGLEPDGDVCQLFMEEYDDSLTTMDVGNVVNFIRSVAGSSLYDQRGCRKRSIAWLDDRTFHRGQSSQQQTSAHAPPAVTSGNCITQQLTTNLPLQSTSASSPTSSGSDIQPARLYHAPLTADELHEFLREKRFDHAIYSDADRRLIHIVDPDAYHFSALIQTATAHQQRSLQDAICRYFALSTSIKATVPEAGYLVFQLEFHIPYFALRRSRPEQDLSERRKRNHRGWMNISFLDVHGQTSETLGTLGIHQAQISVTLCGTDNSRWVAYCFEDRYFEDAEVAEGEQTVIHQEDRIARGEFGAEDTIWDPREYYFRVLLIRMRQVQKEWVELVRLIELGIKDRSWGRFFFSTTRDGIPPANNDDAASTWIDATMQLLGKLIDDIANTNDAWIRFTSATGDLAFFSDTHSDPHMVRTFNQLTDVFDHLQELEKRLRRIAEQCEKWAQTVNLRLTSNSTRNAQLTVFFISPFAIVSVFFTIPVPIIAFDRNLVSFSISILLFTVVLQALLFFWGGKFWRQSWWTKLVGRGKAAWNGDPGLTTKDGDGSTVLKRRNTHAAFV